MNRYIEQLIGDLEKAAISQPVKPYIEAPPQFEGRYDLAELALTPFQTIEELSGINQEAFPDMTQLTGDQCQLICTSIIRVFKNLKLDLTDVPPDLPPEMLYIILRDHWLYPVQYLPSSGMDLEFCTGDPMDCPYGEFCDCGEFSEELDEIPHRFNEPIPKITESIDAGFVCYLNILNLETVDVPQIFIDDPEEYESITGEQYDGEELDRLNGDEYFVFEPLDSNEDFEIMEHFSQNLNDGELQNQLFHALRGRKPFARFKDIISGSIMLDDWFAFKKKWLENHVKKLIWLQINSMTIDFDDDDFL